MLLFANPFYDNALVNNSPPACYSCLHDVANTPIPNDLRIGFVNTLGLLKSMNEIITLLPSKSVSILRVCESFKKLVTTRSKEQPGSIVTETLKNEILKPIVTLKESHFYADFKYISLTSRLVLHIKS